MADAADGLTFVVPLVALVVALALYARFRERDLVDRERKVLAELRLAELRRKIDAEPTRRPPSPELLASYGRTVRAIRELPEVPDR